MRITRLNTQSLSECPKLYDIYFEHFYFSFIEKKKDNKVLFKVPIFAKIENHLTDQNIKFDYNDYAEGFIFEFSQFSLVDEVKEWNLVEINNYFSNPIFNRINWPYELGAYTARVYKTWQHIIKYLDDYEKMLFSVPEATNNIFDENLLFKIHNEFDGELWESISLIDFINSFNGLGNKIKPFIKGDFCYMLGEIEPFRNKNIRLNVANWVKTTFSIPEYKKHKSNSPKNPKRAAIKTRIAHIMK